MISKPKLFDSAYPGSMFERDNGDFVEASDNESLAASLLVNISELRQDLNDARSNWESATEELNAVCQQRDELLSVLKDARRMLAHVTTTSYSSITDEYYEKLDAVIAKAEAV